MQNKLGMEIYARNKSKLLVQKTADKVGEHVNRDNVATRDERRACTITLGL